MSKQPTFEKELLKYLLIATLVPAIALVIALWFYGSSKYFIALVTLSLICLTGFCATTLYQKITFQLRTLSNLLEGMVHGDYSMRGRQSSGDTRNALGQLVGQINALAETLVKQRSAATESQLLVAKVIQHIDVAIIAIDDNQQLALVNPAAERLLNINEQSVLGKSLTAIGAQALLTVKNNDVVKLDFSGNVGKYKVICDQYREQGHQHQLYFITDVNSLLREQERQAWQNLIRVLSHEINNSLSPIASLASTLKNFTKQIDNPALTESFTEGLTVIGDRASSLSQFIQSYRQLSHLPAPNKINCNIEELLAKLPTLFTRKIDIQCPEKVFAEIDPIQIEQVLINLIKNADEALGNKDDAIVVEVIASSNKVTIKIKDEGGGIKNPDNLFTPFYTTKKQGSGIGLALSRQIIEAHNGQISLVNNAENTGCIATVIV